MSAWMRATSDGCSIWSSLRRTWLLAAALVALAAGRICGQEAKWIWTSEHDKDAVPSGAICHFRKTFNVKTPESATIAIAADDSYELFFNGRRVGTGESTKKLLEYDIS